MSDDSLSYQDLFDLRQVRNTLPPGDPRVAKIDGLIKSEGPKVQAKNKKDTASNVARESDYVGAMGRGAKSAAKGVASVAGAFKTRTPDEKSARESWDTALPGGAVPYTALMGIKHMGQDVHTSMHEMAGAREKAAQQGEGVAGQTLEELKKAPIMGGAFTKMMEAGPPAPGNLTNLKPASIEGATEASLYSAPIAEAVGKTAKTVAKIVPPIVGNAARNYASKVSRQMTGIGPEKQTGVDVPARVAEATDKIKTLKNASEHYATKAAESVKAIEDKAVQAKAAGVYTNPQQTATLYKLMDKVYEKSPTLRTMKDFTSLGLDQIKSKLWDPANRTPYIDPVQALELRRDLDELVKYDKHGAKDVQTPVGNAAHTIRTALDKSMDRTIPGWQDLNESASARIKASEALQVRHEQDFGKYIAGGVRDIITHPGSSGASFIAAYEAAGLVPGMPHIGKWMAAVGASGVTRFLYDSLPSQTARIMMANKIADTLIGKTPAKGPSAYPPTIPPARQIVGPRPPIPQGPGGAAGPAGAPQGQLPQGQVAQPPQGGGQNVGAYGVNQAGVNAFNQGNKGPIAAQPANPQAAQSMAEQAFREAAVKAGMKAEEIENLVQKGAQGRMKGPGAANIDDPNFRGHL